MVLASGPVADLWAALGELASNNGVWPTGLSALGPWLSVILLALATVIIAVIWRLTARRRGVKPCRLQATPVQPLLRAGNAPHSVSKAPSAPDLGAEPPAQPVPLPAANKDARVPTRSVSSADVSARAPMPARGVKPARARSVGPHAAERGVDATHTPGTPAPAAKRGKSRKAAVPSPGAVIAQAQVLSKRGQYAKARTALTTCLRQVHEVKARARSATKMAEHGLALAELHLALAEVEAGDGDLTSACEHWRTARDGFAAQHDAQRQAVAAARMEAMRCPTDWVLTDF